MYKCNIYIYTYFGRAMSSLSNEQCKNSNHVVVHPQGVDLNPFAEVDDTTSCTKLPPLSITENSLTIITTK